MIKLSSQLEDQLLQNLVDKYQSKGINLQRILDNPLFQQLSLDKKVSFIEKAGSPLLQRPVYSNMDRLKDFGTGAVGGGIAGAIGLMMSNMAKGPVGNPGVAMGTAVGAGLLLGGVGNMLKSRMNAVHDINTYNTLNRTGSGLQVIMNRETPNRDSWVVPEMPKLDVVSAARYAGDNYEVLTKDQHHVGS